MGGCCSNHTGPSSTGDDDGLMDLKDITPVQYEAIVRLQRNVRGNQSRQATAKKRETVQTYDRQEFLGPFMKRFMVATNRPENDAHWDSTDPEWVGRASMAQRHRFLIRRDLHWRWFNGLVFGMVDTIGNIGDRGFCSVDAVTEVEEMQQAAVLYVNNARRSEGWSENIGLFYHIYGHNSVNSMHLHIVDLDFVGPGFHKMKHKNISIEAVLQVLREAVASSPTQEAAELPPDVVVRRTRSSIYPRMSFKTDITKACPVVNDAATFKAAREELWNMGGPRRLREVMITEGFLSPDSHKLTTNMTPFNVFARIAHQDTQSRSVVALLKTATVRKTPTR